MKTLKLGNLFVIAVCVATMGSASTACAQSVHHDKMDAQAARRDIARLQKDRRRALKYKNWGKVAQDDRLIGSDRLWILKDKHKIHHASR